MHLNYRQAVLEGIRDSILLKVFSSSPSNLITVERLFYAKQQKAIIISVFIHVHIGEKSYLIEE